MSWFRTALTVCMPDPGSFYTVVDPIQFYEWRFTQTAPKGILLTRHLPPSDIFTEGKVIASSVIPEDRLKPVDTGFRLKDTVSSDVVLRVGNIQTPQELLDKQSSKIGQFKRALDRFKEDIVTRIFLVSVSEDPHLLKVAKYNDDTVSLHNYGPIEDITKVLAEAREILFAQSQKKKGRSFEVEEFRRFENTMEFVNNPHLHVDSSKLERLLTSAKVEPKTTKKQSWRECFLQNSTGAVALNDEIDYFNKMSWVKASRK